MVDSHPYETIPNRSFNVSHIPVVSSAMAYPLEAYSDAKQSLMQAYRTADRISLEHPGPEESVGEHKPQEAPLKLLAFIFAVARIMYLPVKMSATVAYGIFIQAAAWAQGMANVILKNFFSLVLDNFVGKKVMEGTITLLCSVENFVNGIVAPLEGEVSICDGQTIKVSDERFLWYLKRFALLPVTLGRRVVVRVTSVPPLSILLRIPGEVRVFCITSFRLFFWVLEQLRVLAEKVFYHKLPEVSKEVREGDQFAEIVHTLLDSFPTIVVPVVSLAKNVVNFVLGVQLFSGVAERPVAGHQDNTNGSEGRGDSNPAA